MPMSQNLHYAGVETPLLLKMFLKPVWEGKMHGVTKIHCFVSERLANQPTTVLELGLSVALFELIRTLWQDFFAFL